MRPTTTARSKGSFLLARVGQTEAAIAGKLSIAPGQVHGWLTGQRRPQTQNRLKLQELFQIPLLSWDEAYKGKALAPRQPKRSAGDPKQGKRSPTAAKRVEHQKPCTQMQTVCTNTVQWPAFEANAQPT